MCPERCPGCAPERYLETIGAAPKLQAHSTTIRKRPVGNRTPVDSPLLCGLFASSGQPVDRESFYPIESQSIFRFTGCWGCYAAAVISDDGGILRYRKAPILEAVLDFRWSSPNSLEELMGLLGSPAFAGYGEPKPRVQVDAAVDLAANAVSHQQRQLGFEVALREGSEIVFLEQQALVFIQRAPYDRWEYFFERAMALLIPTVAALSVNAFSRVGLRFVNRIDIPMDGASGIDTDEYVTIKFDGPRKDRGIIEEFQMRVVKPTEKEGIHYALVVATTASPLPNHTAILLDIDVFTPNAVPASGENLMSLMSEMRREKNEIFEECITNKARDLFGGVAG